MLCLLFVQIHLTFTFQAVLQQILYNGLEYQQSPMLHVMLSMVVASQILCCALVIQELAAKMHVKEILVGHLFAMKEEKLSLLVL